MSVVVLSVGAPPELTAATASLLRQEPRPEVVVVNSGGGDVRLRLPPGAEAVIVRSFEGILWPGAARNRGIEASSAPFVAFLAADCLAEDGWVAARLRRHEAGTASVASAVVNDAPRNLVAIASHLFLFIRRLPQTPEPLALPYGASYARRLFNEIGAFREDLRIGEDTEFRLRLRGDDTPVWAPEVRTVHRSPTALVTALREHHGRGLRSARIWPQRHEGSLPRRVGRRVRGTAATIREVLGGRDRLAAYASLPIVALLAFATELGAGRGLRDLDPVALHEGDATTAARRAQWHRAEPAWRAAEAASPGRLAPLQGRAEALMGLKRYEEAATLYDEIRRRWPTLLVGHEGFAQAAAARRRWKLSIEAWSAADRLSPGRVTPTAGRARALLERGETAKAAALYHELQEHHPDHPAGYQGALRLALDDEDWAAALAATGALWTRFRDFEALEQRIVLLVGLQRAEEADALLREMQAAGPPPVNHLRAAAAVLDAMRASERLAALLKANEATVAADPTLLNAYVAALARQGRAAEALPLLESLPAWQGRPSATLVVALTFAGRQDEVHRRMRVYWETGNAGRVPGFLLPSVLAAAREDGGLPLVRTLLDRLDGEAPRSWDGDALRLVALFHRARLESLEALDVSPPRLFCPEPAIEEQAAALVADRPADIRTRKHHEVAALCDRFKRLRRRQEVFVPDAGFVLKEAVEVAIRLLEAVDAGRPLSLVRLGDGEGNLLPYPDGREAACRSDLQMTQRSWWGATLPDEEGDGIAAALQDAIRNADVLGIPDLERWLRIVRRQDAPTPAGGKESRNLAAVMSFVERLEERPGRVLTTCHIHQSFAVWGLWGPLLRRFGRVSLVTCHEALAPALRQRFGIEVERCFLVPPENKFSPAFGATLARPHYPDVFMDLRHELPRAAEGRVVLVAAGVLGKIYCNWVRAAGGAAIDIGSAADAWCGYATRGLAEMEDARSTIDTAPGLRALAERDPRVALLFDRGA